MLPLQDPTPQPPIPVTFWPQLLVRLKAKNPKFFNVLAANSIYFSLITAGFPFLVTTILPLAQIPVPTWLTYANRLVLALVAFFSGAGLGSAFASQTTLIGSTPPLINSEKPTVESLQKELEQLRAQIDKSPTTDPTETV